MEGIGKGLTGAFILISSVSMSLGAIVTWGILGRKPLRSTIPIEPGIELVIQDNQVDTLHVYEIE